MTERRPLHLRAIGLSKDFGTSSPPTRVLHDVDLDVAHGEFLVIMGASGSGKSTLLNCLSGMDQATNGTVHFDGTELTSLPNDEMSRVRLTRMGFVFQRTYMLENLSIRDNILLPALKAAHVTEPPVAEHDVVARVDQLIERLGLSSVAHHATTRVSGGQLQRAGLCRALCTEPEIVFADEPTGALNSSMTQEVLDLLGEANASGTTVVMVTHDPVCAARGDRVVYLRDGSITSTVDLGRWRAGDAGRRETEVMSWLASFGF